MHRNVRTEADLINSHVHFACISTCRIFDNKTLGYERRLNILP